MTTKQLLIVEDNVAEAIWAQYYAIKAGIKDLVVATNLEDAQRYLPQVKKVATDLFFTSGNMCAHPHIQRFLPLYEKYRTENFPKIKEPNVVLESVKKCAEVFNVTPSEYVENFMAKMNTASITLSAAREAVAGIKDYENYQKFLKIEEEIRTGKSLPLGIIVCEQARERGLASAIVTSTDHHDLAFRPIQGLIRATYFDTLLEESKNWKAAIDYLLGEGSN